jgi:hypothetical protein
MKQKNKQSLMYKITKLKFLANHYALGFTIGILFPLLFLSVLSVFWKEYKHINILFFWKNELTNYTAIYYQLLSLIVLGNMLPFYIFDYYKKYKTKAGILLSVLFIYLPFILYLKFRA